MASGLNSFANETRSLIFSCAVKTFTSNYSLFSLKILRVVVPTDPVDPNIDIVLFVTTLS